MRQKIYSKPAIRRRLALAQAVASNVDPIIRVKGISGIISKDAEG
jgi:hypothetical protein